MTDEERKAIELLKILNNEVLDYANKNSDNEDILSGEFYTKKDNIFMFKVLIDLINKQEKAIDRMAKHIEKFTGSCPLDKCLWEECNKECENQMAECWKEYFMEDKE